MPSSEPAEREARPSPVPSLLILLCFVASGFAALVYEIAWIRSSALVFGSTNHALSTVLAVFFLGWAIGSRVFGRISERTHRPLRWFAGIELGIAVFALASGWVFAAIDGLYGAAYPSIQGSFLATTALRAGLILVCLLPPTVLMGGTLPLLCQHFAGNRDRLAPTIGGLYGLNTLGAALGCAVCGFLLIPTVGISTAVRIAAAINLAIAVAVWFLPVRKQMPIEDAPAATSEGKPPRPMRGLLPTLFFAIGFVALGYEIVWTRYLSLFIQNSVHTYTLTLTLVLVGIGIGGPLAGMLLRRASKGTGPLGVVQIVLGLVVVGLLLHGIGTWASMSVQFAQGDTSRRVVLLAGVLLLPAILMGMTFPLAIRPAVEAPESLGARVGKMAFYNTVGGVVGSLVTGFLLLPHIGQQATIVVLTGASLAVGIGALFAVSTPGSSRTLPTLVSGLAVVAWSGLLWSSSVTVPRDLLAPAGRLVAFAEGVNSNLAVIATEGDKHLEIDGSWQGGQRPSHLILAAHLPMLTHPNPKSVLSIGLGVGQSSRRFLMYEVERLDCVEIEGALPGLLRQEFDGAWMDDPRVRIEIEDGRSFVAHTDRRYDVVSIAVGQTYRPGVAGFYTTEFYRDAREVLNADGLIAQFIPTQLLTTEEFRTMIATFLGVFPQAGLWYNTAEMLLIGRKSDQLVIHAARLGQLLENRQAHDDLRYSPWGGPADWLNRPETLLGSFLSGPRGLQAIAGDAAVYSDDRPWLEYSTARPIHSPEQQHAVLDLIDGNLDSFDSWFDLPPAAASIEFSHQVRARNLGDLRATLLAQDAAVLRTSDVKTAEQVLRKAVTLNPRNTVIRRDLAYLLLDTKRSKEAVAELQSALDIDVRDAHTHNALGNALVSQGDKDKAFSSFERAVQLDSGLSVALQNLGGLLLERGEREAGVARLRAAVTADPYSAEARLLLGRALIQDGSVVAGVDALSAALRLQPGSPRIAQTLVWNLASHPEPDLPPATEAVAMAETMAAATNHRSAAILDILAAAHAKAGDFPAATRWAQRALDLAQQDQGKELAQSIAARLELYQAGKPFFQTH